MIENYNDISPEISDSVYVSPSASVIGNVQINNDASVWPMASIRGDVNYIKIGKGTNIQDNCVLHVTHDGPYTPKGQALIIGDNVTVGHSVTLHACTIDDLSLIGIGSIILDKVIVQKNVLVGAGSLVPPNKVLESGYLYLGNPVKKIRKLTTDEINNFEYSAKHYIKLKNTYM